MIAEKLVDWDLQARFFGPRQSSRGREEGEASVSRSAFADGAPWGGLATVAAVLPLEFCLHWIENRFRVLNPLHAGVHRRLLPELVMFMDVVIGPDWFRTVDSASSVV